MKSKREAKTSSDIRVPWIGGDKKECDVLSFTLAVKRSTMPASCKFEAFPVSISSPAWLSPFAWADLKVLKTSLAFNPAFSAIARTTTWRRETTFNEDQGKQFYILYVQLLFKMPW